MTPEQARIVGVAFFAVGGLAVAALALWLLCWLWLKALDILVDALGLTKACKEYIWHRDEFRRWKKRRNDVHEVEEE